MNLTLQRKLYLVLAAMAVAGLAIIITLFSEMSSVIYSEREALLKSEVAQVKQSYDNLVREAASGKITDEQAKTEFIQLINQSRWGENLDGYFWIQDSTPTMIDHPLKPALNDRFLGDITDQNGLTLFIEMAKIKNGALEYYWAKPDDPEGSYPKLSYLVYLDKWDWIVGTGLYTDDINAQVLNTEIKIGSIVLLILSVAMVTLGKVFGDTIKQLGGEPTDITQLAGNIAEGHYQTDTPDTANPETIAGSIYRINNKLTSTLSDIQRSSVALTENITEQQDVYAKMNSNSSNITRQLDTVATATNEMSASIAEITANATQSSDLMSEMNASAETGKSSVTDTSRIIDQIANKAESMNIDMSDLASEAHNVSGIVETIQSIAEQTNLLALNAAIEAARAGEQGRGFAVVADEVRTLATRSQDSTDEIQSMLNSLLNKVDGTKESIASTLDMAKTATGISQSAVEKIQNITEVVSTVSDLNFQVATAVEQQSSVSNEISQSIVSIKDSADENSQQVAIMKAQTIELEQSNATLNLAIQKLSKSN